MFVHSIYITKIKQGIEVNGFSLMFKNKISPLQEDLKQISMIRSNIWIIPLSIILAFLFITIFSTSTTILGSVPSFDSSIFQIIGKGWTDGILPYTGLWDHKGPLIFFINAVGFWLCHSNVGIFIIQVVCLTITTYFTLSFYRRYFSDKQSLTYTLASLAFLSICTEGGNSVEEYILPLLMPAFFYMYEWTQRWTNRQDITHSHHYAFLYGVILAFSFLTRLTNALGICIGAVIIAIVLVQQRKYKQLISNILFFLFGFTILVLPFVVYFYSKGALDEMLYGTFYYNIGYAINSYTEFDSIRSIISFLLASASSICLVIVSIITILCDQRRKESGYFWLTLSGITLLFFLNSFQYNHYAIITLPFLCISIVEMTYNLKVIGNRTLKCFIKYGISCFFIVISLGILHEIYQVINVHQYRNQSEEYCRIVLTEIPDHERNSFVTYNINPSCYILLGVTPACRYFFRQDWLIRNNSSIQQSVIEAFENSNIKWILVRDKIWNRDVRKALSKKYTIHAQSKDLTLLRLNE